MDHEISIELNTEETTSHNNIVFDIKGNNITGLHKSIINSLRRTLLSSINTVGFRTSIDSSDIIVKKNTTSLHSEYLLHRIALIPLYINPKEYNKSFLFKLNVESSSENPLKLITCKDFQIFKLKKDIDPDTLKDIDINNYEKEELSDENKETMFRPFTFKDTKNYSIITELKSVSSSSVQGLELYGVPRISTAYEDSRWQAVSKSTYKFKHNPELFQKIIQEKIKVNEIPEEKEEKYIKELTISESERYFYRDTNCEPYWYTFMIDSVHYYNSKELFIEANEILIDQLTLFKDELPKLSSDEENIFSLDINENTYHLIVEGFDDTIGNIIQSHISLYVIEDDSIPSLCGYKKTHPLENTIEFYLTFNPNNKISKSDNQKKLNALIQTFQETCENLIIIYSNIKKEAVLNL